jgi:hypothetical protein
MIIYNDLKSDSATLTVDDELSNYPVENIQESRLSRIFKNAALESSIVFDMGEAVSVDCIAILKHNLSEYATITLQGNDSDSWTSPAFEQEITYSSDNITLEYTTQTYRYFRLYINDSTNSDGYIQLSRVIIGEYYQPPGILAEAEDSLIDESVKTRSKSGQSYTDLRYKARSMSFNFPIVGTYEKTEMMDVFETLGQSTATIFVFGEIGLDISSLYATINQDTLTATMYDDGRTYAIDLSILEEK